MATLREMGTPRDGNT